MVLVTDPALAREVVGVLKTRNAFETTIAALADADIGSGQLSVLSSHESIVAANSEGNPWRGVQPALVVDAKYEGPLVAPGLIVLAGGQMAITVAGMIGAAVGSVVFKELMNGIAAEPYMEAFTRTVEAGALFSGCELTMKPPRIRRLTFSLLRPRITFTLNWRKAETCCGNSN